jgi:UDP-glucose 4-epimerase
VKVLVTGGAGFIGSHIVDLLVFEGHDVAVVDNLVGGARSNVNGNARFHQVDLGSVRFERVLRFEQPEVVFHQAAQMSVKASVDDPMYDAQVNILGLINLLEACAVAGVRKVVFASSGATYGNPVYLPIDEQHPQRPASPYGITKMAGEMYLAYYAQSFGVQFTALRYGNVYGPRQSPHGEAGVVAIFTHQLLAGQTPVVHWDGEQTRDYVYVADVALANLLAANAGDGKSYCIATGVGTSVNQIVSLLADVIGTPVVPARAPRRAGDLRSAYFDVTRAQTELGWRPTVSLPDGLQKTVDAARRGMLARPPMMGIPA